MVRHLVVWTFDDEKLPRENRAAYAKKIKTALEGLINRIDGLMISTVYTEVLPGSDGDIMLDSLFESEEALKAYQVHPEHLKAAELIAAVKKTRFCMDFPVEFEE